MDSGLGIYSTLSEKPTRGRDGGRSVALSNGGPNGSELSSLTGCAESDRAMYGSSGCSKGVVGRLLLRRG